MANSIANSANRLAPVALAIVTLAVIVGVGSIVLANFDEAAYQTSDFQNEVDQPATPFPTNYTVSVATDADFQYLVEDTETIIFEDTSATTNTTLTVDTDYVVYSDEGTYELLNTTDTEDYTSSEDNIYFEYEYKYSSDANSILDTGASALQTFADFFTVIVVIGVAAVLFLLLRAVRGAGRMASE